ISVNVVNGGKDLIEVFDNGSGIEKSELKKAVMPHATSKIRTSSDLDNIKTLGFRGEALASISSVSKLKITSKTINEDIGYSFEVEGDVEGEIYEAPCNNGTYITVRNVFFNTPARQKFLKTARSEENEVTNTVSRLILANPNVSIKYSVENGTLMQSFGDGIEDVLIAVYGEEIIKNCFKISNYSNGIKIEGYVGKHNYTKSTRSYQTTILNGRYIENQTIQSAVHNAYSGYLMKRRYPFFVLYITMPSEVVDVNVTPNKSDVRFIDNSVVYGSIYSTISKVLDGTDSALNILVSDNETFFKSPERLNAELNMPKTEKEAELISLSNNPSKNLKYGKDDFSKNKFEFAFIREDNNIFGLSTQTENPPKPEIDVFAENKKYIEELEKKKAIKQEEIESTSALDLRYVGQILKTYLIFEGNGDMYIIDQHAAHERLLFNKLMSSRYNKEITVQPLIVPFLIDINSIEFEKIITKKEYFDNLGFDLCVLSNQIIVKALPLEILDIDLAQFFSEFFNDNNLSKETLPEIIREKIIQKACKSAIKSGMELSDLEVKSLIKLLNGNINLKCPHGRPIAVKISRYEIDKWFKRIV
ncbi:MAG: ATP-binding protein, partial [Clostridia bacterium]|nr:ATP-binding protein [Clostridia bacterium]